MHVIRRIRQPVREQNSALEGLVAPVWEVAYGTQLKWGITCGDLFSIVQSRMYLLQHRSRLRHILRE
jgi:hypothetical protein